MYFHSLDNYQKIQSQLEKGLSALKIEVNLSQIEKLMEFIALLHKWNKTYNLTAIRDLTEMVSHHLLDSLIAKQFLENTSIDVSTVIDVGTGPGIPGIPLAILMPNTKFTLVDSKKKKLKFVQHVRSRLQLANIEIIGARVEDLNDDRKFQVVLSRAFSSLTNFVTLCGRLCKPEGMLLAYKGEPENIDLAGCFEDQFSIDKIEEVIVPTLNKRRCLVFVKKS